jgi:hypothetical protein
VTRPPNLKSPHTSFKPKTLEDEKIIEDFKKLAAQDGIKLYDLYIEAFQLLFKAHHWPPGNPQLTLQSSLEKRVSLGKCTAKNCTFQAVIVGTNLIAKKEHRFCKKHFAELPQRHDAKLWKWKDSEKK